jgi:hypothetical protein
VLSFLLDENISYEVARQLTAKRPEIPIVSVHHWLEGIYLQASDREVLLAAIPERKTLVTYDLETIPPLLVHLHQEGYHHAGVVLVNQRSIASNDYGRLLRALVQLWEDGKDRDWTDEVVFLHSTQD